MTSFIKKDKGMVLTELLSLVILLLTLVVVIIATTNLVVTSQSMTRTLKSISNALTSQDKCIKNPLCVKKINKILFD